MVESLVTLSLKVLGLILEVVNIRISLVILQEMSHEDSEKGRSRSLAPCYPTGKSLNHLEQME